MCNAGARQGDTCTDEHWFVLHAAAVPSVGTILQPPLLADGASASKWLQVMATQRDVARSRYDLLPVLGKYMDVTADSPVRETGKHANPVGWPLAFYRVLWCGVFGYVTLANKVLPAPRVLFYVYGLNRRG